MSLPGSALANNMDFRQWPLETQVAQLFMVGYAGIEPQAITRRFLERGVGGVIFFRDNFDALPDARVVAEQLVTLQQTIPSGLPKLLMGIDQEGGQVERLPHRYFPTVLTPRAVALSPSPEALAGDMYASLARHLVQLGFNLDFFPTLDVNYNRRNPIIGVRSFGDDPETVWRFGKIALEAFHQAGLIAVGKHFPGHGNGDVDSHLDLPTLHFTEAELQPFKQAIDAGLPAMLVAHGYYPALQTTDFEKSVPSSASPAIIQGLLRERLGFDGVVMTDDMCMGAITRHRSPVDAAIASLRAGVDILLYKQSTEDEWAVYEAVLNAFRDGGLPMEQLHASLARILKLKAWVQSKTPSTFAAEEFSEAACRKKADEIASRGIGILHGDAALLPLALEQPLLLVHPDRREMGNYAFDVPTSDDLDILLRQTGFSAMESLAYPLKSGFSIPEALGNLQQAPKTICMVTFNPLLGPRQAALLDTLKSRFPEARLILVSAGTPYDLDILPTPDLHFSLCSYRPASMRALAKGLAGGLLG